MRITIVSPRSRSATREGGIRPCRASINPHTCRRTLARAAAIRSRWSGPISSSARHSVGVRGHRPEQLVLIPQHRQVRHHPAAVGDQHRGVGQHPAPVVHRGEPAPAQRLRQRAGQPGPVGQQPQRRGPGVRHDPVPADFHGQIPRPRGKLIHLKGAPRSRQNVGFDTLILPGQGHLSPFRHAPRQDRHELSGQWSGSARALLTAWRSPGPARAERLALGAGKHRPPPRFTWVRLAGPVGSGQLRHGVDRGRGAGRDGHAQSKSSSRARRIACSRLETSSRL